MDKPEGFHKPYIPLLPLKLQENQSSFSFDGHFVFRHFATSKKYNKLLNVYLLSIDARTTTSIFGRF